MSGVKVKRDRKLVSKRGGRVPRDHIFVYILRYLVRDGPSFYLCGVFLSSLSLLNTIWRTDLEVRFNPVLKRKGREGVKGALGIGTFDMERSHSFSIQHWLLR